MYTNKNKILILKFKYAFLAPRKVNQILLLALPSLAPEGRKFEIFELSHSENILKNILYFLYPKWMLYDI